MKILAIDIGAGTQDILLFDSQKKIENCISLVLPTPSKFFADKLKTIEGHVYIHGDTIGGGSLGRAILRHIQKGYRVVMEESAAYSIRNDLDEVKNMERMLRKDNRPETFHFLEDSIPDHYLRMKSAVAAVKRSSPVRVLVMDTAFSAILGCLEETSGPSLIVNVGNGHTIAALIIEKRIDGLYEHHTHELTPGKMEHDLRLFVRGELDGKKVFKENGHGAVPLKPLPGVFPVIVTGPNRDLFRKTSFKFIYAAPGGNTMMTGPMGLVRAVQYRFGQIAN